MVSQSPPHKHSSSPPPTSPTSDMHSSQRLWLVGEVGFIKWITIWNLIILLRHLITNFFPTQNRIQKHTHTTSNIPYHIYHTTRTTSPIYIHTHYHKQPPTHPPIDHLSTTLFSHHGQEGLLEVVVDGWVSDDLVPKDHQAQVVDVVHVVLLHVHTVLCVCWYIWVCLYVCVYVWVNMYKYKHMSSQD